MGRMGHLKCRYFSADFETTVYKNQINTEVWSAAIVELYTEDVRIFNSIDLFLSYLDLIKGNLVVYFHNLKFDGTFILDWLLRNKKYNEAGTDYIDGVPTGFYTDKDMQNNTYKYSISDRGMFYTITLKNRNRIIEFRDSLKLLPFKVSDISDAFKTSRKKLEIEYKGFRQAGGVITDKEKEYISNDVLIVKEAIEHMFNDGHDKLTIGSCALKEYKDIVKKSLRIPMDWNEMFPNLYEEFIGNNELSVGEWILRSYKGGWCYLKKGMESKIVKKGLTLDVTSLYPSQMHSKGGHKYPIGYPKYWKGNYIPEEARKDRYYFIRVRTRFKLKDGKLPFIQVKRSLLYKATEHLETSDIYYEKTGKYYRYFDEKGNKIDTRVLLTLTMTDYQLMIENYELFDFEIIDGYYFYQIEGLFDEYIDKYIAIKNSEKGAKRTIAKLFLNSLYGKFGMNTDSSFKVCYLKNDRLAYKPVYQNDKTPGYIPIGSAITSYAREFTIRAAQKNLHDDKGFVYADTDSIHCYNYTLEDCKGVIVAENKLCTWKHESNWSDAIFVRQKTYIEKIDGEYDIKCAGMNDRAKDILIKSFTGNFERNNTEFSEEEYEFLFNKFGDKIYRDLSDFKIGIEVPGKLMAKRIPGGTVLYDTLYKMR